jgi:hypothetical protein
LKVESTDAPWEKTTDATTDYLLEQNWDDLMEMILAEVRVTM